MEEMFKEKMLSTMWTSQVYGHHDKMARTKHTEPHKTRSKQGRNRHKEITIFCVFQ